MKIKKEKMPVRIRKAQKSDAEFLGFSVTQAIGDGLTESLGGGPEGRPVVERLFSELAAVEASQYSYINSFIAENEHGEPVGAIIAYDGANLIKLRRAFIAKANELLGWSVTEQEAEEWEPEAGPDEIYIDTLYVRDDYRRQGIATALINRVIENHRDIGKPYGILVDPVNDRARKLYHKIGFRQDCINPFCGVPMYHLLLR